MKRGHFLRTSFMDDPKLKTLLFNNSYPEPSSSPYLPPPSQPQTPSTISVVFRNWTRGWTYKRRMRTGSPPAGSTGRTPVGAAASIWFEIWRVMDPGQKFRFFRLIFRLIFEKFRLFSGNFTQKVKFSRQIFKKFRFFQANF